MLARNTHLRRARTEIFWGEVAPAEHSVQIYDDNSLFIDALEGFASGGFRAGDSIVVIASKAHRSALERRLRVRGYDLEQAQRENRYIAVDAADALSKFMVDGWPDEDLFKKMVGPLFERARTDGRRVRAFGEMVVLLWNQGLTAATIQLEHLWNEALEREEFCLFCAYPRRSFNGDAETAIEEICSHHSRIIPE